MENNFVPTLGNTETSEIVYTESTSKKSVYKKCNSLCKN